jgi:hypothetical protein
MVAFLSSFGREIIIYGRYFQKKRIEYPIFRNQSGDMLRNRSHSVEEDRTLADLGVQACHGKKKSVYKVGLRGFSVVYQRYWCKFADIY